MGGGRRGGCDSNARHSWIPGAGRAIATMTEAITTTLSITAAILLQWSEPTADVERSGYATYYNPGIMRQVVDNRGIYIPDGYIAVAGNRVADIGRRIEIVWPSGRKDAAIIVDCAEKDLYHRRLNDLEDSDDDKLIEVPARIAKREGFFGWGPWPVVIRFLPEWLLEPNEEGVYIQ